MFYNICKKLKIKQSKLFIFCFLFLVTLVSLYPLFQPQAIDGDDIGYHLFRIEGIKNAILNGDMFAFIHPNVCHNYGYGSGFFYPQLLLYFPALLRVMGVSATGAYKVFVIFITLLTCVSAYFSTKYISKSRYTALCFTTLFLLSQYRLTNVYIRAAVGEYCAFIFLPILLAGIFNLIYENFDKSWILILGFWGLLCTHTITLAISGTVFIVMLLFNIKKVFHKDIILKLIRSGLITLLLSCFYWLPMIEQMCSGRFGFNAPWAKVSRFTFKFSRLFVMVPQQGGGIGLSILFLLVIGILIRNRNKNIIKLADKWCIIGIALMLFTTDLIPWNYLDNTLANSIQFPWRIFSVATAVLCISLAIYINEYSKGKTRKNMLVFVSMVVGTFSVVFLNPLLSRTLDIHSNYFDPNMNTAYNMGASYCEWIPLGTDLSLINDEYHVILENGSKVSLDYKKGTTVSFETNDNSDYYDVPLIYYKGYSSRITLEDGSIKGLETFKSPNNNLVRVANPRGLNGKITVHYEITFLQRLSYTISILTIITILTLALFKDFNFKKSSLE